MKRRVLLQLALNAPLLGIGTSGLAGLLVPASATAAPANGPQRKPEPPTAAPSRRLLVIDPGHGGRDPGAIGVRGTLEKEITLDIAREIARRLRGVPGVAAKLTRDTDIFLPLAERVAIARDAGADLFISIHADSAPNRDARGLSAYTLSDKASDDFAFALAKQENLADGSGGIDLRHTRPQVAAILSDLVARHTVTASLMAKSSLVEGAGRSLRLLDNPKRSANFAVLKAPDVPSVLIETGFLSNPRDEDLLRDVAQRRRIADVLSRELADVMTSAPFA
ncbi:N-acetylmuramoyl-L-alanine amidase [Skermanella sp. TT6]|uniref:N-acetylmuramoyl-L-alanine amidase n=1 Tax=Skermanella cutis TaxID=2775420 RepID=A0ABX7B9I3_9PROT|nr:N-acetylmuramoyl-L-alanine amidase [Skermanella sp. TT6]QQP91034.1 N-acetylmuramoyl-L-alanine amidase [Skermanella sp. TT6]